jgi:polysaccharide export outer membrane protein
MNGFGAAKRILLQAQHHQGIPMKDRSLFLLIGLLSGSFIASGQQTTAIPATEHATAAEQATTAQPVPTVDQVPVQDKSPVQDQESAATTPTKNLPKVAATYILGADDAIQVNVWREAALSGPLSIRPDGMISLPLIGDIRAEGLTPMLLGRNITEQLKKFISNPTVTVTVTAVNSRRIFLVGEVQHVGPLSLSEGLTVIQAIASAGGLTPFANAKHIYILRGAAGKQQKIAFNYKKAIKNGDLQGVSLAPGDTIVVP